MRYPWVMAFLAPTLLAVARAEDADPMIPIELRSVAPNPDGTTASITVSEGIVYSHFTNDGTHYDWTLIDADSGRITEFSVNARYNPELVALSDQYLAYREGENPAKRIFVIDRKTGQKTESIRLKDPIFAGFIDGNRLLVFQGANALAFSLPQMKLEGTFPIPTGSVARRWGGGFAILGRDLQLLDGNLAPQRVIPLLRHEERGNISCGAYGLEVSGQRALILHGCGLVDTIDLTTGKPGPVIDVGPRLKTLAVIKDTLYVADAPEDSYGRIRAFDLATGRFLAQRKGVANVLVAGRSRLLALGRSPILEKTAPFTLYAPNPAALASDGVSLARVVASCRTPVDESRSVDQLIDECEAAGIQRFTGRADAPVHSRGALTQYADWLSRSYSRFAEALVVLNAIPASPRAGEMRALVDRKQRLLGPAMNQPDGRPQAAGVRTFPLPPGLTTVSFFDQYMIVRTWACNNNAMGGPAMGGPEIDIHDRASLTMLSPVTVAACDDDFQDNVGSIYKIGDHLLFEIEYRYGSATRPNVGAIDLKHGTLTGKIHMDDGIESLSIWNGTVLRCPPDDLATVLDVSTLKFSSASPAAAGACKDQIATPLRNSWNSLLEQATYGNLSTARYDVSRKDQPDGSLHLLVALRGENAAPIPVDVPRNAQFVALPDRDAVVVSYPAEGERAIAILDLAVRSWTPLFRLHDASTWGGINAWRNFLFLSRGRDLMTYDLGSKVVVDYERNIIREGFQPVCPSCSDGNDIRSVLVDGDRLFLATLDGVHTRVIDLPVFTKRFSGGDFFAQRP